MPGSILLGKYRIDELIGTGGMANVVRASHLYLHQPVAIKLLLPEMVESESTVQRFLREAQATVKLRSEHSARVMDVGTTPDGVPFMVMEFLDGNDLNQILRHHGPQQPAIVVDLMLQACEGIAEAHALGIVHRDIKPSNFFITRRPDGSMLLKILDFGISKTPVGYGDLTGTQTVIGTPSYMAPEQMKSGRDADPRSDIWSIGVVMYQLINGRPPFAGESYAELVLKVGLEPPQPIHVPLPAGLGEVILRCLEKDPQARYQTVGDLARMLAPYATDPIAGAQSATRALRILQQRGAQGMQGMQGSPFTAGGGLAAPIPISPAQLTPRSWPPSQTSQGSSVSRGAGQVTMGTRSTRGWLVAAVAGLCVVAGGGGYAISQMSKSERASGPHVMAPLAQPTAESPPATPGATATPSPAAPTTPAPAATQTGSDAPPTWRPITPSPTLVDHAAHAADGKPADSKPDAAADGKPATSRLVDSKQPAGDPFSNAKSVAPRPPAERKATERKATEAKPAEAKPAETKPAETKPAETKPAAKPATKPTKPAKPKPSDDLFYNRK